MSAPRPTRLRVYHSSALHGTSQSSAHHLMAALLQVYPSYQSASHLLPCATQPSLAPFALISFIILGLGLVRWLRISSRIAIARHGRVQSTPRPAHPRCYGCIARMSVELASGLQDTVLFMVSSFCFSGFSSSLLRGVSVLARLLSPGAVF